MGKYSKEVAHRISEPARRDINQVISHNGSDEHYCTKFVWYLGKCWYTHENLCTKLDEELQESCEEERIRRHKAVRVECLASA